MKVSKPKLKKTPSTLRRKNRRERLLKETPTVMCSVTDLIPPSLRPHALAEHRYLSACKGKVLSGPFAGMSYISQAACSALPPKLIGCYERELQNVIESVLRRSPRHVVDIGAAEGYYAIGFAVRSPGMRITAFEMDDTARRLALELAILNRVTDQVELFGECTPELLRENLNEHESCFLICDAEGAELHLLDPSRVPQLCKTEILVELHEFVVLGITEILLKRFGRTHNISQISAKERTAEDLPSNVSSRLLNRWMIRIVGEERPPGMSWLHMVPFPCPAS